MMKCDDVSLEALVDPENINADDIDVHNPDVAQHVESCKQCQNRLAELAADADQWEEMLRQLSTKVSNDSDAEYLGAHQRWKRPVAWNDAMAKTLLSPASHPEMLGRVGRYDVERLIGSGGMGVVFKAYDTELNRPVAVKLLAPYLSASGAARNRFAREARAAAAVVDDHVVPIHNVETGDEHPFLVMKYIAGGSLQQRLNREGPLDVCEVLRIGMQTAKGLAAAHAQGLIHRDVKPSNILLDEGVDRALLTDFGLARATDDANLTRSGFHPGTPHYMSPEQVRGEAIDDRSDLFGLGCVLYGLCTGHPPFRSETSYAVLRRITDDIPRPIRETNPDVPAWLEQIVMKLLAKSAADRFESADQVAELLEDCLAHIQQPTTMPLPESLRTTSTESFFVMLSKSFGFVRNPNLSDRSDDVRKPPIGKLIATAAFGFFLVLAGITIVLELNKGTLSIESETNDVPIRIMQGDTIYERLTVSQEAKTIRIASGKYVVEVDGEFTDMSVVGGVVSLGRGKTEIVKIVKSDELRTADAVLPDLQNPSTAKSIHGVAAADLNRDGLLDQIIGNHEQTDQPRKIQVWGPETAGERAVAGDPPSDDEVLQVLKEARPASSGVPMLIEKQRSNIRIIKEKIADFVDPPRFYPNVGRAKLHHAHYKCTIHFDEKTKVGYPVPHTLKKEDAIDVVYIDHTHFHIVGDAGNAKLGQSKVDFSKLSSLRDRLHEADRVVHQMEESVKRWQERVELYKKHPSGRVNGKDIPNSDSIEDAQESLVSVKSQRARYIRDRDFLHREVMSQFVILRKQHEVALGEVALAKEEAEASQQLYRKGTTTKLNVNAKQQAAAKLELHSIGLAELVQQCTSLIEEFDIEQPQDAKRVLNRKSTARDFPADKAEELIGSWRVKEFRDTSAKAVLENTVFTFGKWTMTRLTESEEPQKHIYRILPENRLAFNSLIDSPKNEASVQTHYYYSFHDVNNLALHACDSDGKPTSGRMLLQRVADGSSLPTYVSHVISVDTDETYGWDERAFVDTHSRLIRSKKLLESLKRQPEFDLIPVEEKVSDWLRENLEIKVTEGNEIEIGMHGHVHTMTQRDQIVATVAGAYRDMIAEFKTEASKDVIRLLRKAHAEVVVRRDAAEGVYHQLLLNDPVDPSSLVKSKADLIRFNDLLTKISEKLFEFGVPAIAGSTELGVD